MALISEGRFQEAIDTALEAVQLLPEWPDSYLTLAEAYHQLEEWPKVVEWASDVLRRGQPESLLILNPLDYTFQPRLVLSSALGALGRIDEAIKVGEEGLQLIPTHGGLRAAYGGWLAARKREKTAHTYCTLAQQLIAHDEQLKALTLLEDTVPYFARDHADVVAMRSQLRERVRPLLDPDAYAEHYVSGGSKPEDFVKDEDVDRIGGALPRCAFLLEGILEQSGAAA